MRPRILALSLALSGCATFGGRHPDENWQRVTSPHFVLWTDFDAKTAVEAATELESTRDELVATAWPAHDFSPSARAEVFVLTDGFEFERLFGPKTDGVFLQRPRPTFYLYGEPDHWEKAASLREAPNSRVRHEMTHQLAAQVYANEPRWFSEGLAQYLETVRYSSDGRSVVVGAKNVAAMALYMRARTVSLQSTLAWNEAPTFLSTTDAAGFYGTSWLFVHWLFATHPDQFAAYRTALASGVDPAAAWSDAFPGFDAEATNRELWYYAKFSDFQKRDVLPARRHHLVLEAEPLDTALGHVARARLAFASMLVSPEHDARELEVEFEVARALELDPTNVDALEMDLWERMPARLVRARLTAEAHPNDARAFTLLARILTKMQPGTDEEEAAYRRAVELDPTSADALRALAEALLDRKKPLEALPLALRAVTHAPHDSAIVDTCAVALFRTGRCQAAIQHELRALELLRDAPVPAAQLADFTRHLSEFRTACETASP